MNFLTRDGGGRGGRGARGPALQGEVVKGVRLEAILEAAVRQLRRGPGRGTLCLACRPECENYYNPNKANDCSDS